MDLGIIVAKTTKDVIGRGNKLPWIADKEPLKGDLARFQQLTKGQAVVMGRNTYESIPVKRDSQNGKLPLLPGRKNIVLSRRSQGIHSDAAVTSSLHQAIGIAQREHYSILWAMGGVQVYEEALELANVMEVTEVHKDYEGDIYFPEVNWDHWKEVERKVAEAGTHSYVTYERRR